METENGIYYGILSTEVYLDIYIHITDRCTLLSTPTFALLPNHSVIIISTITPATFRSQKMAQDLAFYVGKFLIS